MASWYNKNNTKWTAKDVGAHWDDLVYTWDSIIAGWDSRLRPGEWFTIAAVVWYTKTLSDWYAKASTGWYTKKYSSG